ncbi:inositol monophosphatase [Actinosynnema sp. NPDC023658]|uniref:inositol monophosphatase family protein n=1 Tax=Actinosynnema sp. NPDC023658 TaxID=3155465 RepID=UPI0033C82FC7
MRPLDQLAAIAQKAVAIGNSLIKTTRPRTVIEKSDRDTYTDVDVRIQSKIRSYLADATPEIDFTGEEEDGGQQFDGNAHGWVLDPIDGTSNFVHGVPLCGVSLALIEEGQAIVAAIALPYSDLLYVAARGHGTEVNGRAIRTSDTVELSKAMIAIGDYATGEGSTSKNRQRMKLTAQLATNVERIRMFGSAAHDLTWLADGRIDGTVILSNKAHDIAAGVLISREAGALVLDSDGSDHGLNSAHTVAVTPGIADDLLALIQSSVRE